MERETIGRGTAEWSAAEGFIERTRCPLCYMRESYRKARPETCKPKLQRRENGGYRCTRYRSAAGRW